MSGYLKCWLKCNLFSWWLHLEKPELAKEKVYLLRTYWYSFNSTSLSKQYLFLEDFKVKIKKVEQ